MNTSHQDESRRPKVERLLCGERMKPHFIHTLELVPQADGCHYKLAHAFGMVTQRTGLITVPAGFKTDLASVPRIFWMFIPPFGKYDDAAVVHDWLYRTHITSRVVADATFLIGMKIKGVGFLQRWAMWTAVRIFGRFCWGRPERQIVIHHHHIVHPIHKDEGREAKVESQNEPSEPSSFGHRPSTHQ